MLKLSPDTVLSILVLRPGASVQLLLVIVRSLSNLLGRRPWTQCHTITPHILKVVCPLVTF